MEAIISSTEPSPTGLELDQERGAGVGSVSTTVGGIQSVSQDSTIVTKESFQQKQNLICYSLLEQETNEIRVLVLQPGSQTDPIHGTLEVHQIEHCPEFEALSYAWGSPDLTEEIFLYGSRVKVTQSVKVALQHLRYTESSRILWIDAICINQSDMDERNYQVSIMSHVYSSAKLVLVWLGEARGQSDIAMNRIEELANDSKLDVAGKDSALSNLIYDTLFRREWWSRLWVIQEVVLARADPLVICGFSSLSWSIFMKGCQEAILLIDDTVNWDILYDLAQLMRLRDDPTLRENKDEDNPRLNALLKTSKSSLATDPRDKIYGCLGLITKREREAIKPDYQKPVEMVYLQVTKHILQTCNQAFYSYYSVDNTENGSIQPWVPDFSSQMALSPKNPLTLGLSGMNVFGYRTVSFQDDDKILAINGIFFDTIQETVELQDIQRLPNQISGLECLTQKANQRRISPNYQNYCFQRLKIEVDMQNVICQGVYSRDDQDFQETWDKLLHLAKFPSREDSKDISLTEPEFWLRHVIVGRYFFVTKMGFVGVATERIQENDSVTYLFGEKLPTILRYQDSHCMIIGAAHVSGIKNEELFEIYQEGHIKEQTFLIH